MFIGYARVSTFDQNLDLQIDALKKVGCEKIYTDQLSGAKADRPGLVQALAFARKGDTLVVWRLDRLGRSLRHLILTVEEMQGRGIALKSLQDSIDTATAAGQLQFHMIAALAQFERSLIQERTNAGLVAARARGRLGGRPKKLTPEQIEMAASLMKDKHVSVKQICATLQVGRTTLYTYVSPNGEVRAPAKSVHRL
jgi:DNA invertase Pin-like site-specific DNA recombinase